MKNVFFLLLCLASVVVTAQSSTSARMVSSSTSVSVSETEDDYSLSVNIGRGNAAAVSAAVMAAINVSERNARTDEFRGTAEYKTDYGTELTANTKRGTVKLKSKRGNASSRAEAERMARVIIRELGLDQPAPPAPPSVN